MTSGEGIISTDYQNVNLETLKKQNKLLDLEIEKKKVELEMLKVQLRRMKGEQQ